METSLEHDALMGALVALVNHLCVNGMSASGFTSRLLAAAETMRANGKEDSATLMMKMWERPIESLVLMQSEPAPPPQ